MHKNDGVCVCVTDSIQQVVRKVSERERESQWTRRVETEGEGEKVKKGNSKAEQGDRLVSGHWPSPH